MDKLEIPEDLTTLSGEALTEFKTKAIAAHGALVASKEPTEFSEDEVTELEKLTAAVGAASALEATRAGEATARAERVAAATQGLAASTTIDEPETPEVPETPASSDGESGGGAGGEAVAPTTSSTTASAVAPVINVTIGNEVVKEAADEVIRRMAGTGQRPVTPGKRNGRAGMIATRDINGQGGKVWAAGSVLDGMGDLAAAFEANADRVIPRSGHVGGQQTHFSTATLSRGKDAFDGFYTGNPDFASDMDLITAAAKESRLPGNSLVAAGGWCAPSETLYDLCSNESLDGLIQLPEIQVNRGGIRFTTGPDFSVIYDSAGFCQTEAEAIAGTAKPCIEVPCPVFEEVRLDACGLCVRAPILTNAGYPELVRRWIEGTFIAHQHKVSARLIASMAAQLGTAQLAPDTGSAAASVLNSIELAAEGIRYKYRMARAETLELIAPLWLLAVLRADLALRNGRATEDVSDEEIRAHFARRGVAPQFVYDWQPLIYPDTDPGAPVVPGCVVEYPENVEILLYPAGTFLKGTSDVINLDTVYDTTSLQANMYTAAFFEEGVFVAQVCFSGCRLTIPLCVSGRTGAANIDLCTVVVP